MSQLTALMAAAAIALAGVVLWRWRASRTHPRLDPALAEFRRKFEQANPDTSPLSAAEIAKLESWRASRALPALRLDPVPGGTIGQGGSRIGGPLWLPPGETWPVDANGVPLEFIAQLDFGAMPPLPGFPSEGIAQFFVERSDLFGANFDDPANTAARIIWRPVLQDAAPYRSPRLTEQNRSPYTDFSPLTDALSEHGLALTATPFDSLPETNDWHHDAHLEGQLRRQGLDSLEEHWMDQSQPPMHQMGGHPTFTQMDFRTPDHYADYDRVLLRLTSKDGVQWGDMGEAVFMIRAADLAACDFSRVAFYWDCS